MKDVSYILNHLAEEEENYYGAVTPPIVQTSNFSFKTVEELRNAFKDEVVSYLYTRGNNPTVEILRKKIAALATAEDALVFSSGAAAVSAAVLSVVKTGDHIISVAKPYSWTKKLFTEYLSRFGIEVTFIDGSRLQNFISAKKANTQLVFLESPNSFTFELQDIQAVADWAKTENIATVIDNSYCTSLGQECIKMGIDLEVHSGTKYYGGHSDVVCGIVIGNKKRINHIFETEFQGIGGIISPFEAWLLLRSIRTLPLRLKKITDTTQKVVDFLKEREEVESLIFPFDESFNQFELARKQMLWCGGLFSVYFKNREEDKIVRFCNSLKAFRMAVSWGGHESLIMPALAFYPESAPAVEPFTKNLVRFYIGLEESDFLIEDLKQSLLNLK